jgi:hypothetical protein
MTRAASYDCNASRTIYNFGSLLLGIKTAAILHS